MPSYKLTYFDMKGRAELPRMIMHYGGIQFEDERVTGADWAAIKSTKLFGGQLPQLEIDGKSVLTESGAIVRFLSNITGLTPSDDLQAAEVDMLTCKAGEMFDQASSFHFEKDEAKKAELKKLYEEEKLPKILQCLEDYLGNSDYFVGGKISAADLTVVSHLSQVQDAGCSYDEKIFPKIKNLVEKVVVDPKLKAYMAKSK